MEIDPDRVPLFKLILHTVQILIAFVVWVLEIAVFTGKDAKVVGNNGWTFGVCFISIPAWIYLIMTPRFARTRRFAAPWAMLGVDLFCTILWLSAFATQAAYNTADLCGARCSLSKAIVGLGVINTLFFAASTFISGYTMTYYNFHGTLPGYDNRQIRTGSNDIDPDKEAFSMAPHGDEAYERVQMDDHEHDHANANASANGQGSYNSRYGSSNPYSGGARYDDEDPDRYGALPPRNQAPLFDSSTEYNPGAGGAAPASMPYRPPAAEDYHEPPQFPAANYDRSAP